MRLDACFSRNMRRNELTPLLVKLVEQPFRLKRHNNAMPRGRGRIIIGARVEDLLLLDLWHIKQHEVEAVRRVACRSEAHP